MLHVLLFHFTSIDPAAGIEPDYSDSDNDDSGKSEVEADGLAPPSSDRDNNALSENDWAKIVASAGLFVCCGGIGASLKHNSPEVRCTTDALYFAASNAVVLLGC